MLPCKMAGREIERDVVDYSVKDSCMPRYNRNSKDFYSISNLMPVLAMLVVLWNFVRGIIREAGQNLYSMSFLNQVLCYLIDGKTIRPIILSDYNNPHFSISVLPRFSWFFRFLVLLFLQITCVHRAT